MQSSQVGLSLPQVIPLEDTVPVAVYAATVLVDVSPGSTQSVTPGGLYASDAEEYSSDGTSEGLSTALMFVWRPVLVAVASVSVWLITVVEMAKGVIKG